MLCAHRGLSGSCCSPFPMAPARARLSIVTASGIAVLQLPEMGSDPSGGLFGDRSCDCCVVELTGPVAALELLLRRRSIFTRREGRSTLKKAGSGRKSWLHSGFVCFEI